DPAHAPHRERTDPHRAAAGPADDLREARREGLQGVRDTDEEPALRQRAVIPGERGRDAFGPDASVRRERIATRGERAATEPERARADHAAVADDREGRDVPAEPHHAGVGRPGLHAAPRERAAAASCASRIARSISAETIADVEFARSNVVRTWNVRTSSPSSATIARSAAPERSAAANAVASAAPTAARSVTSPPVTASG